MTARDGRSLRVVFLDIDGVLNSATTPSGGDWPDQHVNPQNVEVLDRLVRAADARLVISSAWRQVLDASKIESVLRSHGYSGPAPVGATPVDARGWPGRRAREISAWLRSREREFGYDRGRGNVQGVESFVVLDDEDGLESLRSRTVRTPAATGLADYHVPRAIDVLRRPWSAEERVRTCRR